MRTEAAPAVLKKGSFAYPKQDCWLKNCGFPSYKTPEMLRLLRREEKQCATFLRDHKIIWCNLANLLREPSSSKIMKVTTKVLTKRGSVEPTQNYIIYFLQNFSNSPTKNPLSLFQVSNVVPLAAPSYSDDGHQVLLRGSAQPRRPQRADSKV